MGKLFKFLKPYAAAVAAIICILVVQAYCDLSLPTYTSDIVNIGIQQGGIDETVPDTISEKDLNHLLLLVPSDRQEIVKNAYTKSVMYAMAEKFLDEMDLEEIKEDLKMWKIGKILVDEGRSEGRNEGAIEATQKIIRNMKDKFSVEQIAEVTDMSIKEIEDILQSKA